MTPPRPLRTAATLLSLLFALPAFAQAQPARADNRTIAIGLTPVIVTTNIGFQKRWQSYLSRKLGQKVKFYQRRSYQEIMVMLRYGALDFAWICGYPYVVNRSELRLVAVPLYQGKPFYQSYLIVKNGSSASSLEMLRGKIHAFSDVDSNSGHIVPRYWLYQMGTTPELFFSRYIFTYSHENVMRSVVSGITDSGNVDGYVWEVLNRTDPALRGKTKVIRRSKYYGFPPFVTVKDFPETTLLRMRRVLLEMTQDDEGRGILRELYLDGFSDEDDAIFDGIAKIMRLPRRMAALQSAKGS